MPEDVKPNEKNIRSFKDFVEKVANAGKKVGEQFGDTASNINPYAKLFWENGGKELSTSFGPEVIKAAWQYFTNKTPSDYLKQIDKKRLKDLKALAQIRADITEKRILQESLDEHRSGKRILDSGNLKQQEKRLKKLDKILEGYYPKYPSLRSMIQKGDFNKAQDTLKEEIKNTEEQANEATKAINEGKVPGANVNAANGIGINQSPDQQRFQQYSPEQVSAMNSLLNIGRQGLEGNRFDFGPIEEEARAGFKQKTIPTIAERFSNFGGPGAASGQRSSAFPQLLSQAGSDLERSLASMKQNYNLQREGNLSNLLNLGLRPQFGHAGPLIGGLPQQQSSNIDKFAEYLPQALTGAGDFISKLFNKKDQAAQAQGQELANYKNKIGNSWEALKAVNPKAFEGKVVLPEIYDPKNANTIQKLQSLYPEAYRNVGVSDQTIEDALSGLGQAQF